MYNGNQALVYHLVSDMNVCANEPFQRVRNKKSAPNVEGQNFIGFPNVFLSCFFTSHI